MKKPYGIKDIAHEALELFPKYTKLNSRQKAKAVAIFTQHIISSDVKSPISQATAKKFVKNMFRAARAVK